MTSKQPKTKAKTIVVGDFDAIISASVTSIPLQNNIQSKLANTPKKKIVKKKK